MDTVKILIQKLTEFYPGQDITIEHIQRMRPAVTYSNGTSDPAEYIDVWKLFICTPRKPETAILKMFDDLTPLISYCKKLMHEDENWLNVYPARKRW